MGSIFLFDVKLLSFSPSHVLHSGGCVGFLWSCMSDLGHKVFIDSCELLPQSSWELQSMDLNPVWEKSITGGEMIKCS